MIPCVSPEMLSFYLRKDLSEVRSTFQVLIEIVFARDGGSFLNRTPRSKGTHNLFDNRYNRTPRGGIFLFGGSYGLIVFLVRRDICRSCRLALQFVGWMAPESNQREIA